MNAVAIAPIQGIRFQSANLHRAEYLPAGAEVRISRKGMYWVARDGQGFGSGRMSWEQLNEVVEF